MRIFRRRNLSLYQKFSITIILIGLIPMLVLSSFFANSMIRNYQSALRNQYEKAAGYVNSSFASMLDSYNTISKLPYYYNYSTVDGINPYYLSFDNFRKIVYGEGYEPEHMAEERKQDMENFLKYVESVDSNIYSTHFIAQNTDGSNVSFHYSARSTYFKDQQLFEKVINYIQLDKETNKMILIPTHETGYYTGIAEPVFTIARNYFDLRGAVGNTTYVGTIFLDVNLKKVEKLFRTVKFNGTEVFYIMNDNYDCIYSSDEQYIGKNLEKNIGAMQETEEQLIIHSNNSEYGLQVVVAIDTAEAFREIRNTQRMMYVFLGMSIIALLFGSVYFSKRLTYPIHEMMERMEQVESGNFDIELQVRSLDEIGVLAQRFNQMSGALKTYINQSYVAHIKQNEAELTALKSQIYPHFLYNTLEIIRMTALEEPESNKVPEMIEALSAQIHYLIGPMKDLVNLEQELEIVRKYIYLLNCRIDGKVQLTVNAHNTAVAIVPKLILQPIVENAYVHGIKPKKGKGKILIEANIEEDILHINVLDNGIGMAEEELANIKALLDGDEPGIKNEYNWQSIGLKNVHDRLKYLYGEEYGVCITSTYNVGTMVRLLIPQKGNQS